MNVTKLEYNISNEELYDLISKYVVHGYYYNIISKNNFSKLMKKDLHLDLVDMKDKELGYIWFSYYNLVYLIVSDDLDDLTMICLTDDDLPKLSRMKKINKLLSKINF